MRIRKVLPTIAIALTLVLVGCGGDEAEAPEDGGAAMATESVSVTGLTLGNTVDPDGRVVNETSTFQPGDTIYVSVHTEGTAASATLKAVWTYEDGQVINEANRSIAPSGPATTEFHVSKPDGWPAGGYEVVISLDGAEVDRASFEVEG